MHFILKLLLVAASIFSQVALAIPLAKRASCDSNSTDEPIAPTEDPWYTAPYEFEREAPGTILRVRPAPGNLTSIAGSNCSATYNILYRTTNSRYQPTWAVTTLFVPRTISSALLSFQIPYDSVDLDASPSYSMYGGVLGDVSASLGKRWFVSVPDYEGPLASFTAGVLSGHATIDSIRAILNGASRFQLPNDTKYAMWGYSGGALASEWAAELQVQYAPEMNFSGAVLGGLTPNVTSVFETVNNGAGAGIVPPAIIGISNQYPEILEAGFLKLKPSGPYNSTTFLSTYNMTVTQSVETFAFHNISEYFVDGFADIFNPITAKVVYRDGIMGYHGIPQFPLFVHKAVHDEVSPINDTDKLVSKYCDVGVNILYRRNSIGGHTAEFINGHAAAEAWLDSVLGGSYASQYNSTGCTIQDVAVNVTSLPD